MKESFVLYTSQYEAVRELSLEQKGMLFDAVFQYAITGNMPTVEDKEVKIAFGFIRLQMERNSERYAEVCEKRRAAANKRWSANDAKGCKSMQKHTNADFALHNDNDNVNESDNDNDLPVTKVTMGNEAIASKKTGKTTKKDFSVFETDNGYKIPTAEENEHFIKILKLFNDTITEHCSKINKVIVLSPHRVQLLRRLVIDFDDKQIALGIRKATASSYLNGLTQDRKRPADFDWIMQYDHFVKIFEGGLQ